MSRHCNVDTWFHTLASRVLSRLDCAALCAGAPSYWQDSREVYQLFTNLVCAISGTKLSTIFHLRTLRAPNF